MSFIWPVTELRETRMRLYATIVLAHHPLWHPSLLLLSESIPEKYGLITYHTQKTIRTVLSHYI